VFVVLDAFPFEDVLVLAVPLGLGCVDAEDADLVFGAVAVEGDVDGVAVGDVGDGGVVPRPGFELGVRGARVRGEQTGREAGRDCGLEELSSAHRLVSRPHRTSKLLMVIGCGI
jgi:hypothetical protein